MCLSYYTIQYCSNIPTISLLTDCIFTSLTSYLFCLLTDLLYLTVFAYRLTVYYSTLPSFPFTYSHAYMGVCVTRSVVGCWHLAIIIKVMIIWIQSEISEVLNIMKMNRCPCYDRSYLQIQNYNMVLKCRMTCVLFCK